MSLLNPIGPEPSGVYWRRRLLVLGVVLLVLLAFWFFLLRGRGSSSTPSASPTPSPTAAPTGTANPTSTASPTSGTVPACADSAITVSIKVDGQSFPVGNPVTLTEGIKNSGDTACKRDIGAKANTVIITSGGYPVWSSDDCSPGGGSNVVTMKPGDEYQVTVTWKGELTEGKCPSNPPQAQAGSYDAKGRNGKVDSKQVTFALT